MGLVSQPDPSASSDEQHNVEVQDKIDTAQDDETQNVGVNQYNTPAPAPRAEQEDDQTNNDGALVLEKRSAGTPITGTSETSIANPQLTTPSIKSDCVETNFPFGLNSAHSVRIDHPSIRTSDTVLPSGELFEPPSAPEKEPTTRTIQLGYGDEENAFVTATSATKEPALAVVFLMDSDFLETQEDGDLGAVAFVDKGKGINPREYGGTLYDPSSMIVPAGTTSTGGSDSIEVVGVHSGKGKNLDPEERAWNGMAKYEPGPSRIHFHDHGEMSFQRQGTPLESFGPTKTTDLNDGLPYDPTLPRLSWFPKISPYRFMVLSIPFAIGTVKAALSLKGSVTTPITIEWISGVVIYLVFFLLESYEKRRDIPKYLSWLFKPDCVDLVWYLAAKLSIQRPEYLSNERDDLDFDPGAFITSYRVLVSAAVVFLGSIKATFAYSSFFTDAIWVEWLLGGIVSSFLYFAGLYENNSIGLWSSFFRKDCSHHLFKFGSDRVPPIPIIVFLAFLFVIYSAKVLPSIKQITPNYFEEYTSDFQLPMGPTLSMDEVHLVVLIYIPSIILFFCMLGPLIFCLRIPILTSTSMLPSVIRYYTGKFVGDVERLSQRRPIDRIIYHFVAFGQLLLFVGWNFWFFLFACFLESIAKRESLDLLSKILLFPTLVIVLIYIWIIAATGKLGEIRWWPSRDRLSRLIPPAITNATVTKFFQQQVKALHRPGSPVSIISLAPFIFLFYIISFGGFVPFYLFITGFRGDPVEIALFNLSILSVGLPLVVLPISLAALVDWLAYVGNFRTEL